MYLYDPGCWDADSKATCPPSVDRLGCLPIHFAMVSKAILGALLINWLSLVGAGRLGSFLSSRRSFSGETSREVRTHAPNLFRKLFLAFHISNCKLFSIHRFRILSFVFEAVLIALPLKRK